MDSSIHHRSIFFEGAIPAGFIAESIQKHQSKTSVGAHSIFLGQVRADEIDGKLVKGIEYTAYEAMVHEKMQVIRDEVFGKYSLSCAHVYQSLGFVASGEICLFVFTSAPHRKAAMQACEELVETIKKDLPIWGKEIFTDQSHQWKENT